MGSLVISFLLPITSTPSPPLPSTAPSTHPASQPATMSLKRPVEVVDMIDSTSEPLHQREQSSKKKCWRAGGERTPTANIEMLAWLKAISDLASSGNPSGCLSVIQAGAFGDLVW